MHRDSDDRQRLRVALPNRRSTVLLARAVAAVLAPGDLLVLEGPLGSGKTFFTRAMCRTLGLDSRIRVTSPTFSLIHEYETTPPLAHADLYRLAGEEDLRHLGLRELRDDGWVIVAEWAAPYVGALGGDALLLELSLEPRAARLSARGQRADAQLASLSRIPLPGGSR